MGKQPRYKRTGSAPRTDLSRISKAEIDETLERKKNFPRGKREYRSAEENSDAFLEKKKKRSSPKGKDGLTRIEKCALSRDGAWKEKKRKKKTTEEEKRKRARRPKRLIVEKVEEGRRSFKGVSRSKKRVWNRENAKDAAKSKNLVTSAKKPRWNVRKMRYAKGEEKTAAREGKHLYRVFEGNQTGKRNRDYRYQEPNPPTGKCARGASKREGKEKNRTFQRRSRRKGKQAVEKRGGQEEGDRDWLQKVLQHGKSAPRQERRVGGVAPPKRLVPPPEWGPPLSRERRAEEKRTRFINCSKRPIFAGKRVLRSDRSKKNRGGKGPTRGQPEREGVPWISRSRGINPPQSEPEKRTRCRQGQKKKKHLVSHKKETTWVPTAGGGGLKRGGVSPG